MQGIYRTVEEVAADALRTREGRFRLAVQELVDACYEVKAIGYALSASSRIGGVNVCEDALSSWGWTLERIGERIFNASDTLNTDSAQAIERPGTPSELYRDHGQDEKEKTA